MYYIYVEDNKLNGCGQCQCLNEEIQNIEVSEEVYNAYSEDNLRYVWNGNEIISNPNYKQDKQVEEQERINSLKMTKADFWIALLDKDITKNMVKEKINLIPDEKLKAKTLIRIDDADNFWRGDPSMNVIGQMFKVTPQELNYLFENGEFPKNES